MRWERGPVPFCCLAMVASQAAGCCVAHLRVWVVDGPRWLTERIAPTVFSVFTQDSKRWTNFCCRCLDRSQKPFKVLQVNTRDLLLLSFQLRWGLANTYHVGVAVHFWILQSTYAAAVFKGPQRPMVQSKSSSRDFPAANRGNCPWSDWCPLR